MLPEEFNSIFRANKHSLDFVEGVFYHIEEAGSIAELVARLRKRPGEDALPHSPILVFALNYTDVKGAWLGKQHIVDVGFDMDGVPYTLESAIAHDHNNEQYIAFVRARLGLGWHCLHGDSVTPLDEATLGRELNGGRVGLNDGGVPAWRNYSSPVGYNRSYRALIAVYQRGNSGPSFSHRGGLGLQIDESATTSSMPCKWYRFHVFCVLLCLTFVRPATVGHRASFPGLLNDRQPMGVEVSPIIALQNSNTVESPLPQPTGVFVVLGVLQCVISLYISCRPIHDCCCLCRDPSN